MSDITSHGVTIDELRSTELRCAYPGKFCLNLRALKKNGELHRLCEFHRKKANLNQKRLQQRRRVLRAQMVAGLAHQATQETGEYPHDDGHFQFVDLAAELQLLFDIWQQEASAVPVGQDCFDNFCLNDVTPQDVQLLHDILSHEVQLPLFEDTILQDALAEVEAPEDSLW